MADSERDPDLQEVLVTAFGRHGNRTPTQRVLYEFVVERPLFETMQTCKGVPKLARDNAVEIEQFLRRTK